jgi:hypothetical protein
MLKDLLAESNSPEKTGLCILDTVEPSQQTTTTTTVASSFTSPFLGKDFAWVLRFARDMLPSSSLNNEKFLILDSFTLTQRSALYVDTKGAWMEDTDAPEITRDVFGARLSFETTYHSLYGEVSSADEFATEAATNGGVYKY